MTDTIWWVIAIQSLMILGLLFTTVRLERKLDNLRGGKPGPQGPKGDTGTRGLPGRDGQLAMPDKVFVEGEVFYGVVTRSDGSTISVPIRTVENPHI